MALNTDWESEDSVGCSSPCACNRNGFRVWGLGRCAHGSIDVHHHFQTIQGSR